MSVCWWVYMLVMMGWYTLCSSSPQNEVPLRSSTWISEGESTSVQLKKGHTRRLHFTVRKKSTALTLIVTPCRGNISWSLTATSLTHKPTNYHHWSFEKNTPELWWRKSGGEVKLHFYSGGSQDVYEGRVFDSSSVFTLRVRSAQQDTQVRVYLSEGPALSRLLPELPSDSRVHTLGVGMSSVTLSWRTCSSSVSAQRNEYCVTLSTIQNVRSLCAARVEQENRMGVKIKQHAAGQRAGSHNHPCVCSVVENVCTVSDLLPNTSYYFDVFVVDRVSGNSLAYEGTMARTHAESHTLPGVALREGRPLQVSLTSGEDEGRCFRFRPRGEQKRGLLTLQMCNSTNTLTHTLWVSASARGTELASQEVKDQLIQMWLQGGSSYRISIQLRPKLPLSRKHFRVQSERVCVKLQASSAYHRRGAPSLPHTLHVKSFNTLRSCSSVTLAWTGTEERGLYCLYKRSAAERGETARDRGTQSELRSDTEERRKTPGAAKRERDQHRVKQSQRKSAWVSETGQGGVRFNQWKGKPRGETDQRLRRSSDQDQYRVRWSERRNETERASEVWGETGGVIQDKSEGSVTLQRWSDTDRCLAPESRPPHQRVLCQYFQELDAQRAVTTATVGGLEAGAAYTFDVYLIRRWALPVKYHSITVGTRREC